MPDGDSRSTGRTRLARLRVQRGLTQVRLAQLAGLSPRTLQAIERGELPNPGIRYLSNLALVLGAPLDAVCEDEWLSWSQLFSAAPKGPPAPEE